MSGRTRAARSGFRSGFLVLTFTATLTACAPAGDLGFYNSSAGDVTVSTGDEEFEVASSEGAVLLDYGCTPGDITIELSSGQVVVVSGPVCPEQQVVIRDDEVDLEPAPDRT